MKAQSSNILSWRSVALGLLPSLLVILQSINIWKGVPRVIFIAVPIVFLWIMLFISAILIKEKGVTDICIPVFGAVVWEANLILGMYFNSPNATFLDFLLLLLTLLCLIVLYKLKEKPPTIVWWLLIGFAVFVMFNSLLVLDKAVNWLLYFVTEITSWFIKVIPVLVIGFMLAKHQRLTLWLIVGVVEPIWINNYLIPTGFDYQIWVDPRFETQFALSIFRLLPLFTFLVVLPIIALRSCNRDMYFKQAFLSVVIIGVIVFLRVTILRVPDSTFIFPIPVMWLFFTVVLWMPILLSLAISQSLDSALKAKSYSS